MKYVKTERLFGRAEEGRNFLNQLTTIGKELSIAHIFKHDGITKRVI